MIYTFLYNIHIDLYTYKVKLYGRKNYVSCIAIISAMAINKLNLKIYHYYFTNKNYTQIPPLTKGICPKSNIIQHELIFVPAYVTDFRTQIQ